VRGFFLIGRRSLNEQPHVRDRCRHVEVRQARHEGGRAAARACEEAGVDASAVDVCELHDCFSANELITYEALGFAAEGEGHRLVDSEATTYGGSGPLVNPPAG
jgi:acetyl-CoA acetyltransferase